MFFDLSKAFDSVPHPLLLQALSNIGVCDSLLQWFDSYLTGREQCVVLDGVSSDPIGVLSGVPQGSILGPLLILVYIDQLCSLDQSASTTIQLYADDILLFRPLKTGDSTHYLQADVDKISVIIKQLGLQLNASKTNFLVISRKRKVPQLLLTVDGTPIQQANSHLRTWVFSWHLISHGYLTLMPYVPKLRSN